MARCAEVMSGVGRRWWLRLLLSDWQEAACHSLNGRGDEARREVLLRACLG